MSQVPLTPGPPAGMLLLATKLYAPPPRPDLIARERLLEQLDQGLTGRLILVSGSAGFGKTTLLSQWLAGRGCPAAWLSLDAGDNDPLHLLRYLVAAVQRAAPGTGETCRQLLQMSEPPPLESVLTLLVNELCALPADLVLVLDDYHAIDSAAVHGILTFLIDHMPPPLHLVLATRTDPPLPLARWRSRGQMAEVRTDDLRFSDQEAAAFLNQVMGLDLTVGDVAALVEHTEGWVVGLQMAALSLHGRSAEQTADFVRTFGGSHRYILDYLVEEVLAGQPQEVQSFLLQTSILERLTGPLCETLTEESGGQAMLERLDRANLFLVRLDDERRWYRYHHLFVELLRARLRQSQPGLPSMLHSRAADWYERNGQVAEAVGHALAARDFERAVPLIESSAIELLSRGQMTTLLSWVQALPQETVFDRPPLCIICAWILAFSGHLAETEPLLCAAEGRLEQVGPTADTQGLLGQIAAVRSAAAHMRGEEERAIELGRQALDLLPPALLRARGVVFSSLGHAFSFLDDVESAERACREFAAIGEALGHVWTLVQAKCELAELLKIKGRLREAAGLYREALQAVAARSGQRLASVGMVTVGLGDLLREENDLEAAAREVWDGIEHMPWAAHMRWWENPNALVLGYVALARIRQAQGRPDQAAEAIEQAVALSGSYDVHPEIRASIPACQVRLWQATGDLAAIARWQADMQATKDARSDHPTDEVTAIALARALVAQGAWDRAGSLLARLADTAEAGGRHGRLIEILVLQAVGLFAAGGGEQTSDKTPAALAALDRALALAEPEGYARVFLDEGAPLAELLHLGRRRGLWRTGRLGTYALRLLAWLDQERPDRRAPTSPPPGVPAGSPPLIEPLTERELEVLRLVADGLSNRQIADTLILAVGTVKAHVHSIYGKLDAQGRTQAVARARQLGILS